VHSRFLAFLVACSSDSRQRPADKHPGVILRGNRAAVPSRPSRTADAGNAEPALTISGTNTTLDQPEGSPGSGRCGDHERARTRRASGCSQPTQSADVAPGASIVGSNTRLSQPRDLALDHLGRLYVANTASDSILIFKMARPETCPHWRDRWSNSGLQAPQAIAMTYGGLYVTKRVQ